MLSSLNVAINGKMGCMFFDVFFQKRRHGSFLLASQKNLEKFLGFQLIYLVYNYKPCHGRRTKNVISMTSHSKRCFLDGPVKCQPSFSSATPIKNCSLKPFAIL